MPHTTPKLLWGSDRTVLPVTDGPDEFDDYNRTATPEQEQEAQEQLTRLFEVIDIWQVTDDQRDLVAQPGSPLAGDDRAVNPYHVSHAAIREIGGALDHLHSLRMLVQEARALHTYAPFHPQPCRVRMQRCCCLAAGSEISRRANPPASGP
jgi:hypothetical protein